MPSKIRLDSGRHSTLEWTALVEPDVEAVSSKVCDMEALCRALLAGDHQMLPFGQVVNGLNILSSVELRTSHLPLDLGEAPTCRFPEVCWSSSTRDSASLDAVDQLVQSPISTHKISAQLSHKGKVASLKNIGPPPQVVVGLPKGCASHQGGNGEEQLHADGHETASYEEIMMQGIHLNEEEVLGSSDAHLYINPISEADQMATLGGFSCYAKAVGPIAMGTAPNSPRGLSELAHLGPPALIHQSGEPSSCPGLGKLRHNLEVIRRKLDGSYASAIEDYSNHGSGKLYSGGSGLELNYLSLPIAQGFGEQSSQVDDSERDSSPSVPE
ncbi:hypothetical protein Nepgr_019638 [Nepenthes gracilis]|uniref:Uncharacterized protein n=1 Tax=Nepenthes gracilis TaxID=150966 RepID=A0AAD3SVE5_NEPGR|nr:hypothetical protein Nepgr_019638 [Nepenthes gracilis]